MTGSASGPSSATMKGNTLGHQAGNEGNVAGQAVEPRDDDRALRSSCGGQSGGQLGPAIKPVGALYL